MELLCEGRDSSLRWNDGTNEPIPDALPAMPRDLPASSIKRMSALDPVVEGRSTSVSVPRFTVELPSRPRVFFSNIAEMIFGGVHEGPRSSALDLSSAVGEFWPDVFVRDRLPWLGFVQSVVCHVFAGALLIFLTRFFAMQPQVVVQPATFDHSQVIYYSPSDELPPLDTREDFATPAEKADPEFSHQPIISVPRETDNRVQTVVTPPKVKLNRSVALPNMLAWADEKQPRLAIPDAPLSPASEIKRLPNLENSVVSPPPDAARVNQRRNSPVLQNSVVAPPPELRASNAAAPYQGLQPELIAPPPAVQVPADRRLGTMNIGPSAVIAPAPRLPVFEQRTTPGRNSGMGAAAIVPPPPSVASAGTAGLPGRAIVLNLHPAVSAPPEAPAGNRRGTFAATPQGHAGASGSPGSAGAGSSTTTRANGTAGPKNDIPSGLYIGKAEQPPSRIAGSSGAPKNSTSVNPNLLAMARPSGVGTTSPQPLESAAKLSEPEKAVFAGRRFYSLTLNMPNLNSAGGSWIIRFAELQPESGRRNEAASAPDLSQPTATMKVDPAYPTQLMRENVGGTVILYAVIHSDGHVSDVRVLRGVDERLDHYAAEALTKWKFEPAMKNGSPVAIEATFQIPFHPTRVGTNF
jgi:TonB family protein